MSRPRRCASAAQRRVVDPARARRGRSARRSCGRRRPSGRTPKCSRMPRTPQADRAEGRLGDLGGPQRGLVPCPLVVAERRVRIDPVAQAAAVVERRRVRPRPGRRAAAGTGRPDRGACRRTATPGRGRASPARPAAGPLPTKIPSARAARGPPRPALAAFASRSVARSVASRSTTSRSRQASLGPEPRPRAGRLAAECVPRQVARARRRAPRASASGRSAEKARICTSPSQSIAGLSGSASSSTQWKLLPPKPNALTAARRGWSARGSQGRASVLT